MEQALSLLFTLAGAFVTVGLAFAWNKRRKGEGQYLLFWPIEANGGVQRFLRNATFQGPGARLFRILFFASFTLISAGTFFETLQ